MPGYSKILIIIPTGTNPGFVGNDLLLWTNGAGLNIVATPWGQPLVDQFVGMQ